MQRIIFKQLRENVQKLQGPQSHEFLKYSQSYQREFNRKIQVSSKKDLLKSVVSSDIVFGSDFHAFTQSQKANLRILREVVKSKRPLVLALEAFESKCQKHIDEYLEGKIEEKEFLSVTKYFKHWGFPWEQYKIFFDFAREHHLKIYGLNLRPKKNGRGDLVLRDAHGAKLISQIHLSHPEAIVYVIYGDLHLAKSRLPKMTKKLLSTYSKPRVLTVFQNSEKLYWWLARRKLEEKVDVLKVGSDAFCVVNAPPWVKWQSYITFLEKKVVAEDEADYVDTIYQLCKFLLEIFDIDMHPLDYHLFEKGDLKFVGKIARKTTLAEKRTIENLIRLGRGFFIPRLNIFYLTRHELNHVAFLVGQFIHSRLRREKNICISLPHDFNLLVWREAIGFFASKILNSRRKFESMHEKSNHKVTLIVLEYKLRERLALKYGKKIKKLRHHRTRKYCDYFEAASIIGAELGQKIYTGFIEGSVPLARLRSWLSQTLQPDSIGESFYLSVLKEISRLNLKQVRPEERL